MTLSGAGSAELVAAGLRVTWGPAQALINTEDTFTVQPEGAVILRSRAAGDEIRLNAGTRSLKKLFIDRKIPAHLRPAVPVIADERGVIAVGGIGVNLDRAAGELPAWRIEIESNSGGF